jgi:hypothetical protein
MEQREKKSQSKENYQVQTTMGKTGYSSKGIA